MEILKKLFYFFSKLLRICGVRKFVIKISLKVHVVFAKTFKLGELIEDNEKITW